MKSRSYSQYCGIARALDLIGERWAMLIIRDLLVGPRRYTDLQAGLPKVSTNILATRLKELQERGIVQRVVLASCGLVYELTPYGRALEDVMLSLGRWGFQSMGDPHEGDIVTADSMTMAFRTAFQTQVAANLPPTSYEVHVGEAALHVHIDGTVLDVSRLTPSPQSADDRRSEQPEADITFAAGPAIRQVISGELSPAEAISSGDVHVLNGDVELLNRFAETFHIAPLP